MAVHGGVESPNGALGDANVEKWRPLPGVTEGFYEVSDQGRVRRLPRTVQCTDGRVMRFREKILPGHALPDGHLRVKLQVNGEAVPQMLIHRAVLTAFVRPPSLGEQGLHRNGIPSDNRAENLYWGTDAENAADRKRHRIVPEQCQRGHSKWYVNPRTGTRQCIPCRNAAPCALERKQDAPGRAIGERHPAAVLTEETVREIRAAYASGESQVSLGKRYGLRQSSVSRVVLRKSWKHVT